MGYAAKTLGVAARSVASVSNKLSIGAVLGLAALPVLPLGAVSGAREGRPQAEMAPIELVHTKPVPVTDAAPADPSFQLAARRSHVKRVPKPESEERAPEETAIPAPAKEAAKRAIPASRKTSSISSPEQESTPPPPAA